MDGVETLNLLREDMSNLNHDATVIALTANAISGCREQYLEYGFDDYFYLFYGSEGFYV
jgi:CheY-like chemotaxis protein